MLESTTGRKSAERWKCRKWYQMVIGSKYIWIEVQKSFWKNFRVWCICRPATLNLNSRRMSFTKKGSAFILFRNSTTWKRKGCFSKLKVALKKNLKSSWKFQTILSKIVMLLDKFGMDGYLKFLEESWFDSMELKKNQETFDKTSYLEEVSKLSNGIEPQRWIRDYNLGSRLTFPFCYEKSQEFYEYWF